MTVMLATLCLNEIEHLLNLYDQHKDWPNLTDWVFVESADRVYAEANPEMVSSKGLSVDGTTEYLETLAKTDSRIIHIKYGVSSCPDIAQGKCDSRRQYLLHAEIVKPKFIYVVDADEFYPTVAQQRVIEGMQLGHGHSAFCFKQRHIWRPQSIIDQPLFAWEVVGGFWDIPHCRGWRWQPGLTYRTNHNTPEDQYGRKLDRAIKRYDILNHPNLPECVHLGFASSLRTRAAKHRYYQARGEGRTDKRGWYVESRAAFETWKTGDKLPRNAYVRQYLGLIPEVFNGSS